MKRNFMNLLALAFVISTFTMISCQKDKTVLITGDVTGLTYNSAILQGTVSVETSSDVFFEYGTTTAYGTEVRAIQSPVQGKDVNITTVVTGLLQQTTYHYRTKMITADKTIYGENKSFTTLVDADPFLASMEQSKKTVLIEMFTGVRCGYCPDGAVRAKAVADNNPGRVAIIAVHTGGYANPRDGWANFTTPFGAAIGTKANIKGYPAGQINRVLCSELGVPSQNPGGYAMSRGSYATAAGVILPQDAPVNIGSKATYNPATRELTVKVDLYYVSEVSGSSHINVALVQDKIIAKQSGANDTYEHNNVLRHLITGQWGDIVATEGQTAASKVRKSYTYTIPEDYNGAVIPPGGGAVVIDDLRVIVFVANGETNVLNALVVPVN